MMEFKTLSLDEAAVSSLPEAKRPVYIFEWLRFLERALELSSRKPEIRENNDAFVTLGYELRSGYSSMVCTKARPSGTKVVSTWPLEFGTHSGKPTGISRNFFPGDPSGLA